MASAQTLNSIEATGADITTPGEFWLASSLVAGLKEWRRK